MLLDEAQLNALAPKDRARYMALEHLFAQPGWKVVTALADQKAAEQVQRAAFAQSWDANRLAIGNGAAWNEIKNLEEATQAHYTNLIKQAEQAELERQLIEENSFE